MRTPRLGRVVDLTQLDFMADCLAVAHQGAFTNPLTAVPSGA